MEGEGPDSGGKYMSSKDSINCDPATMTQEQLELRLQQVSY